MIKTAASHLLLGMLLLGMACAGDEEPGSRAQPPAERETSSSSSTSTEIAASCVEVYSPETLANRSFAFDGTVKEYDIRSDPRLPAGQREAPWLTFEVHQWFLGGSGAEASVWMDGVGVETSSGTVEADIGDRLLVAGEPRWGGEPLDDPIAWTCGFTQPWSEDAAEEWEAATA